jgi:hypothetical protein
MISRRRYDLILALYPQSRGFAFVVFEGSLAPVDWGVRHARSTEKNEHCLRLIGSILTLHTPDVLVLQDTSEQGTRRAPRIRELNYRVAELAETHGTLVHAYSRAQVFKRFGERGATTRQGIAELIGKHTPALGLYVPPARKWWKNESARLGIFDAAALAWMFFDTIDPDRQPA